MKKQIISYNKNTFGNLTRVCHFSRIIYLLVFLFSTSLFSQKLWKSTKYSYTIEIPKGYTIEKKIGKNIDFKAVNKKKNRAVIIVAVTVLSKKYSDLSIFDMLGDLETYEEEWELNSREHFDNADLVKFGKSFIDNKECFWMDYYTENYKIFNKSYQIKEGKIIYTITLSCKTIFKDYNQPYWLRFKNSLKIIR